MSRAALAEIVGTLAVIVLLVGCLYLLLLWPR